MKIVLEPLRAERNIIVHSRHPPSSCCRNWIGEMVFRKRYADGLSRLLISDDIVIRGEGPGIDTLLAAPKAWMVRLRGP